VSERIALFELPVAATREMDIEENHIMAYNMKNTF